MLTYHLSKPSGLALALVMALGIAGCGGSSSSDDVIHDDHGHNGGDDQYRIETMGRLAVTESGSSEVRIVNLDDRSLLATFAMVGTPTALYPSSGNRYAVVVQRNDDNVSFIDGGLYTEDHVDHLHDYSEMPRRLSLTLNDHRPTHFQTFRDQSVLFFDGSATAASARAAIFDDAAIGSGVIEYVERDNNMHGAAQIVGDHLFITHRDVAITDTTLPSEVEHHRRQGGSFVFQQRYEAQCPRLHGSASNAMHTAFGCGDGVLLIQHNAADLPARHLANPDTMPADRRVGTLAGHPDVVEFVGIAGQHLFAINPTDDGFREIVWSDGGTRLAHAFDRHGERFLVLDATGMLHILAPAEDWAVRASVAVLERTEESPRPSLAVSQAGEYAYVSDPEAKQIVEINLADATVAGTIPLEFSPAGVVWLGLTEHDR